MVDRIKKDGSYYTIELSTVNFIEDDVHIVYSPALEIGSYGKTKQLAEKNFDSTVSLFFKTQVKRESLPQTLSMLGWSWIEANQRMSPPKESDLKVPYHILMNKDFTLNNRPVSIPA